jgi:glutamyl-tRNA synthetase
VGGEYAPYFQSARHDLYRAAVESLLEIGAAYRDYASAEELKAERDGAQQAGRRFIYSRRWMAANDEQRERFESQGRSAVVRLRMPREGACRFVDLIRGEMEFEWGLEQDHVIQRADGSCLYHLASVVDDHAMRISHVIRAEEHLSNTPRQIFIAQGLGYEPPHFAHLPFVAEPGSRTKLSKRKLDKYLKHPDFLRVYEHGKAIADALGLPTSAQSFNPLVVDFYEQVGYLPHAIVNYLLLLGWALDDKTEFFTRNQMVEQFSLERVNKAPASFDPQKLTAFQEHYMRQLPVEQKTALALPFLQRGGAIPSAAEEQLSAKLARILEAAGDRVKVAGDILDYRYFFVADDELAYDEKALAKRIGRPEGAADRLARFRKLLATAEPFDAPTLEELMQEFVAAEEIKIGQIIHAVRVAVTGKAVGFGMFETLEILGRESCLARIDNTLSKVRS